MNLQPPHGLEDATISVISTTKTWVEKFVIDLNLCPFAKSPFKSDKIRYSVFHGTDMEQFLQSIISELNYLKNTPAAECETTLHIHPDILNDFMDYNDFQAAMDELLIEMELEGEIQIAGFHPLYRFAGTRANSAENYTNRSPFPTLHLIREDSMEKAIESYPNIESIYEKNIQTMNGLGFSKVKEMLDGIISNAAPK